MAHFQPSAASPHLAHSRAAGACIVWFPPRYASRTQGRAVRGRPRLRPSSAAMLGEGRDLMFQQEIKDTVQQAYAAIATGAGETVARQLYSDQELSEVPLGAVEWALGVGNPVRYAPLQPGQTVLDVGSGGGIDTILAARRVGPEGRAVGLDVLEEMCERGRRHAAQAGVEGWTEFRQGEMEDIPLPDESVDMVVSNGVLNLSARKSRALAEIFRVLGPGGRMCMADLTVEGELPPEVANDQSAWAG